MNPLDIVICVPLLIGAFFGFKRGLVMELSRMVALILGVYAAARFSHLLTDYIYNNSDVNSEMLPIISFCIVMLGMMVLIHLLAKLIDGSLKAIALGWALKISGAAFGIMRIAFILSLILMIGQRSDLFKSLEDTQTVKESKLYQPMADFSEMVMPALRSIDKDTWIDQLDRKAEKAKEKIEGLFH
jgi:membrane protein required for colicin V production